MARVMANVENDASGMGSCSPGCLAVVSCAPACLAEVFLFGLNLALPILVDDDFAVCLQMSRSYSNRLDFLLPFRS